jgi:hypothetical protein
VAVQLRRLRGGTKARRLRRHCVLVQLRRSASRHRGEEVAEAAGRGEEAAHLVQMQRRRISSSCGEAVEAGVEEVEADSGIEEADSGVEEAEPASRRRRWFSLTMAAVERAGMRESWVRGK